MIKVAQGNMHRSWIAEQLMYQIQREIKADLWLISEQYPGGNPNPATWFDDELGTAAIWVANPGRVPVEASGRGRGFVWVRSKTVTYVSCYLTPTGPVQAYYTKLHDIEDFKREVRMRYTRTEPGVLNSVGHQLHGGKAFCKECLAPRPIFLLHTIECSELRTLVASAGLRTVHIRYQPAQS